MGFGILEGILYSEKNRARGSSEGLSALKSRAMLTRGRSRVASWLSNRLGEKKWPERCPSRCANSSGDTYSRTDIRGKYKICKEQK